MRELQAAYSHHKFSGLVVDSYEKCLLGASRLERVCLWFQLHPEDITEIPRNVLEFKEKLKPNLCEYPMRKFSSHFNVVRRIRRAMSESSLPHCVIRGIKETSHKREVEIWSFLSQYAVMLVGTTLFLFAEILLVRFLIYVKYYELRANRIAPGVVKNSLIWEQLEMKFETKTL